MNSECHNGPAATASAQQPAASAARVRAALAPPHEIDTLAATISHVGDAIDELTRGVLSLGETVAGSSSSGAMNPDLDHLPPEARALSWHLDELAARLRAARAFAETANDWSRELTRRRAASSQLAGRSDRRRVRPR